MDIEPELQVLLWLYPAIAVEYEGTAEPEGKFSCFEDGHP